MDKQSRIKAVEEKLAECQRELERVRAEDDFVPKAVGDVFIKGGERYILAQVDNFMVGLISLVDGNRFRNPVRVEMVREVSESEWLEICGDPNKWSKVSNPWGEKNG